MFMENNIIDTDFKKNKYKIVKNFISKELAFFLFSYLFLKRNVHHTLIERKQIPPFSEYFGTYDDHQIPYTYANYGDVAMDNLLFLCKGKVEKIMGKDLVETYSYCRMYKKGDELKRHKDRPSCESSVTLNLGGDDWPIYLSPTENVGVPDGKDITIESNAKGIKVDLEPGDALFYMGCELEHWREPFQGQHCGQVFLHYADAKHKDRLYDGRPHLGLPGNLRV